MSTTASRRPDGRAILERVYDQFLLGAWAGIAEEWECRQLLADLLQAEFASVPRSQKRLDNSGTEAV